MRCKSMCLGATLLGAALALSGCGGNDSKASTNDSKALAIAKQLVTDSLKSPSSFSPTSTKIVFRGVNKEGDPAYIVRVDYDAQNSFGAMLRGCNLAAFYLKSDNKFGYMQNGLDSCLGSPGSKDEAFGIEIDRKANEFTEVAEVKPEPAKVEKSAATEEVEKAPVVSTVSEPEPASLINTREPAESSTPAAQSAYEVVTEKGQFGTMSVLKTEDFTYFVQVNGKRMPSKLEGASVAVEKQWSYPGRDVYLMALHSGGNGCPADYFFVTVENGAATMTNEFGTCSDTPDVSEDNGNIKVEIASMVEDAPGTIVRFQAGNFTEEKGVGTQRRLAVSRMAI